MSYFNKNDDLNEVEKNKYECIVNGQKVDIKKKIHEENKEIYALMKKLSEINKNDEYFNPDKLHEFDYRFMISWIGKTFKPKKILEIGTRSGCSLVCLLHSYKNYKNVEVFSFDLWREYKINMIRNGKISYVASNLIPSPVKRKLAQQRVIRNLEHMGIGINKLNIRFFNGDSRCDVPNFFEKNKELMVDYALVDGGHDKHTAWCDLMNVVKHINTGGILVFDDLIDNYDLITVWNDFKNYFNESFDFFEFKVNKGFGYAIKK